MALENRQNEIEVIDEDLDTLDQSIKRLRIEYDQFFLGVTRRPPTVLLGKTQKLIIRFASSPPRNTRQKFVYNQLNSKFQMMRQQWGRTQRQIEDGTYLPHRFKARLHQSEPSPAAPVGVPPAPVSEGGVASAERAGLDRLYQALVAARRRTGETGGVDREGLARIVRQQSASIREKYGKARVRFKVVIEGEKAKVKASVSRG